MPIAIQVQNLSKRYKIKTKNDFLIFELYHKLKKSLTRSKEDEKLVIWALRDVEFTLNRGESMGVVGPNGAGKSTLLKLLGGITEPTSGKITMNGKVSSLIEVGAGFHPELTGRENIYLNASILGMKKREIQKKVDRIIDFAEIEPFIDMPVKRYSSGMYVRLGFSVAVHIDPEILLVDEILSVGDASFRAKCSYKIQEIRRQGTTILLVSHNNLSISMNCDKAVYIDKGQVRYYGETQEVITEYEKDIALREEQQLKKMMAEKEDLVLDQTSRISISSFELLDSNGNKKEIFETGEKMVIRIAYVAHDMIRDPVFAFGLLRNDGLLCFGTLSNLNNLTFADIKGRGEVYIEINKVNLLKGVYHLTMGVFEHSGKYQIYMNLDIARFRMVTEKHHHGAFYIEHNWRVQTF